MTHPHKRRTGVPRLLYAMRYSLDGMRAAYRDESAFRQEVWAAVVLLPLSFWVGQGWTEVVLLAGSVVLVLIVELLNTAVESTVDRISFEMNDLAKRAKDLGSAAVMLTLMLCAGVWLAAAWQRVQAP